MMEDDMDYLEMIIRKGEQSRALFEVLMSTIGLELSTTITTNDLVKRLKEVQDDYNNATETLRTIIEDRGKMLKRTTLKHTIIKEDNDVENESCVI